jgi:predicted metal-dependent enzyme (double-stranded beta helix superfamily)
MLPPANHPASTVSTESIMTTLLLREVTDCSRPRIDEPTRLERQRKRLRALLRGVTSVPLVVPARCRQTPLPYVRTLIRKDEHFEIASAHWIAGRSCVLHGHSGSTVLFQVLSGMLVEERYVPDGRGGYRYETQTLQAGQESWLTAGCFHRVHCIEDAATIHAFDPPPSNAVEPVPLELLAVFETARRTAAKPTA